MNTSHIYEIIVNATTEKVWQAITDGEITRKYYYHTRIESDWKVGSHFCYYTSGGSVLLDGEVIEIEPHCHLKTLWRPSWLDIEPSTLAWDLQPLGSITLLKLTHTNIDNDVFEQALMHQGWIFILSSVKTLLETGRALPAVETACESPCPSEE